MPGRYRCPKCFLLHNNTTWFTLFLGYMFTLCKLPKSKVPSPPIEVLQRLSVDQMAISHLVKIHVLKLSVFAQKGIYFKPTILHEFLCGNYNMFRKQKIVVLLNS